MDKNLLIELINKTLEFNNIQSFNDIIDFKSNTLYNNKLYSIKDKQWLDKNDRKDSEVMLYQLYEKNIYIFIKGLIENPIPKYLKCFHPFDIYFIIGQCNNYYIVVSSNFNLMLVILDKENIFPTIDSKFIPLHVEKNN